MNRADRRRRLIGILLVTAAAAAGVAAVAPPPATRAAPPAADGTSRTKVSPLVEGALEAGGALVATSAANAAPDLVDVEIDVVDHPALIRALAGVGGVVTGDVAGVLVQARVHPSALETLARHPAGRGLRSPRPVGIVPSADTTTLLPNADHLTDLGVPAWHAAGLDGTGVKVGIIDFFDASSWTSTLGPFPDPAHRRCLNTGSSCDDRFFTGMPGGEHGVAVAEALLDVAPGVEIYIATAATTADTRAAVDWLADNGVRILVRSLVDLYDGPGDGRGPLDAVVDHATARGIVWLNAAGNQGVDGYYRGLSKDTNGNGVIEFGPGADEFLRIDGCALLGGLRWHTDWDLPPAQRQDYDLYVYAAPTTDGTPVVNLDQPVFVSDLDQRGTFGPAQTPLEGVGAELLCPPPGYSHYVRVERFAGARDDNDVLELLVFPVVGTIAIEHVSSVTPASYSASVPVVDSASRSLLAVGATVSPTSLEVAPYSNRGPTNDGRTKPDLVAPSCLPSSLFQPCFAGTSAGPPLAGGAAALLLQAGMASPGRPLAAAVKHLTIDVPPRGFDSASGWGVLRLGPAPAAGVDGAPGRYTPLDAPRRLLDTRPATAVGPPALSGPLAVDEIRTLQVTGSAGVPATGVSAVAVNLTTVRPLELGYVQLLPSRVRGAAVGGFSNLNVDQAGRTVANFAIVPVGPSGAVDIYTASGGHVVVDVLGWFGPSAATSEGRLVGVEPVRALDTRPGTRQRVPSGWDPTRVPRSGDAIRVPVPGGAGIPADSSVRALVMNVTATGATSTAVVQAFPTGASGVIGTTSTLNVTPGRAVANTVIVPVGSDGTVSLYLEAVGGGSAHLVADVTGYITSTAAVVASSGRYVPVTPGRVLDTRVTGGMFRSQEVRTLLIAQAAGPNPAVPVGAGAAVVNLTVTRSQTIGYLAAWPAGSSATSTSSLNWPGAGTTVANASVVKLSPDGAINLLSASNATTGPLAHHLVDVFGWFTG